MFCGPEDPNKLETRLSFNSRCPIVPAFNEKGRFSCRRSFSALFGLMLTLLRLMAPKGECVSYERFPITIVERDIELALIKSKEVLVERLLDLIVDCS